MTQPESTSDHEEQPKREPCEPFFLFVLFARTRHRRIAQRFLTSILRQYGKEAPAVLREWAEELEALAREEGDKLPQFDLDEALGRRIFFQSK